MQEWVCFNSTGGRGTAKVRLKCKLYDAKMLKMTWCKMINSCIGPKATLSSSLQESYNQQTKEPAREMSSTFVCPTRLKQLAMSIPSESIMYAFKCLSSCSLTLPDLCSCCCIIASCRGVPDRGFKRGWPAAGSG